VDSPLFPSYVFIKLDSSADYFNCLSLNGVLYFVRQGKDVARVDESVIRNLQMVVAEPAAEIIVSAERFAPGEKQLVCDGPFAGFSCEIIRHNGKRKALVRIDIIQRNLVVDMPLENLLPATEALRAYSGDSN
jgi:transcription antitermination factor NusG